VKNQWMSGFEGKNPERRIRGWHVLGWALWLLAMGSFQAEAGPYLDSAHGNGTNGVSRDATSGVYVAGNCGHCHEQHASIGGSEPVPSGGSPSPFLAFAGHNAATNPEQPVSQSDNYCFYCHAGSGSVQSGGTIDNKDYSATFGGYTTNSPAGIFEAFSDGASHHNLYDLHDYARNNFSAWFKADSNPCLACHNVHTAKRNKSDPDNPALTAISRPGDHGNLWGDGAGETVSDYSPYYQAPFYYNSTVTYEPGATLTQDGSLHPDYNTFCLDCHRDAIIRKSGGTIKAIDWETMGGDAAGGDKHGKNGATGGLFMQEPYKSSSIGMGFVLSCLDCHEPHGSSNAWLIRRSINGQAVVSNPANQSVGTLTYYDYVCGRCHTPVPGTQSWKDIHHEDLVEAPYNGPGSPGSIDCTAVCHTSGVNTPILCSRCHYHGAVVTDCNKTAPAIRRTF